MKKKIASCCLVSTLFSVKNSDDKTHKIVTLCGIKFKFKRSAKTFPKAKGELRNLQLANACVLRIFDKILNKNNLTYWLDHGTLLGSIRHKGYIPWDDDIDIAMPRKDYEKVRNQIYKEFEELGFELNQGEGYKKQILRFLYKNSALQIDIFPHETYYKKTNKEEKQELYKSISDCYNTFYKKFPQEDLRSDKIKFDINELLKFQNEIVYKNNPSIEGGTIFNGCEFLTYAKPEIYDWEDIYPLKKREFEGYKFNIPNNYDKYLTQMYGDYMSLPKKVKTHKGIIEKLASNKSIENVKNELYLLIDKIN